MFVLKCLKRSIAVTGLAVILLTGFVLPAAAWAEKKMPDDFAYVHDLAPEIILDMRYYNGRNFVGTQIDGYESNTAILEKHAAAALAAANKTAMQRGYCIKLWDAYRPQRAVNHFLRWADDLADQSTKVEFYPNIDKADIFVLDYLAYKSEHTRGSAVDMTLVDVKTGQELDMGGTYAMLDQVSHLDAQGLTKEQEQNRALILEIMEQAGFEPYEKEWWHFHFINDPYPDTYFDFPVK